MSFDDLPHDWHQLPLTDPTHIADVLDVFVGVQAQFDSALLILICDEERRPIQPVRIENLDDVDAEQLREALPRLAMTITANHPKATVLCAIARDGGLAATPEDLAWREHLRESLSPLLPVIGVHLVTPDGSRPLDA